MKSVLVAILLLLGHSFGTADDLSGPNHTTIKRTAWGSIFYDPLSLGNHQYNYKLDDIQIKSNSGEVRIIGSENSGYRLRCGPDEMTITSNFSGFEIRWREKVWSLEILNGRYTLKSNSPKDVIVYERNGNDFTVKGSNGFVAVNSIPGALSIKSSLGNASVSSYMGSRSFSGVALDQLPYFGRGIYISFHGVGLLIDMLKLFPRPEMAEWIEWKPLIGPPFDPTFR